MNPFSFNGTTTVAPGILVRSVIGAARALSLLPFGTLCFAGYSDGGKGGGTVYRFSSIETAKMVLRGGALLQALTDSANAGASGDLIAVVLGAKSGSNAAITGAEANGTLASGDEGDWTKNIAFQIVNGTTGGTVAFTVQYPDATTGQIVTKGGVGTAFDNIATLSALKAAIEADPVLTPPAATGLPPIVTLTVTTDGLPNTIGLTNLAGGTGNGTGSPTFAEVKAGVDELDDVGFDLGHLVGVYDEPSQTYADGKAQAHSVFGYLKKWIHQVHATGASANQTKAQNSAAVVNAGIAAASALNSFRSNVYPQQVYIQDPSTGNVALRDVVPTIMGVAAYVGANDQWGPASPLTHVYLPGVVDVDFPVLKTNGDQDRAIQGGVSLVETIGLPAPGNVRVVQSVTTQPNDPQTGQPWLLSEFSCVRAADAVLANVKAAIETKRPRAVGGGNNVRQLAAIITEVVKVLELAVDKQWLTGYDRSSIQIGTSGPTGSDDLLTYSASVTPPLNHLGITQTLLPFSAVVNLGGQVSG